MQNIFDNLGYHKLFYAVVNLHYHKYSYFMYWYFVFTSNSKAQHLNLCGLSAKVSTSRALIILLYCPCNLFMVVWWSIAFN
jgi:hypothetical protein